MHGTMNIKIQRNISRYPFNTDTGRSQSRSGRLEEIIICCLLSQIEPQFLGQPTVTLTNAISQLPCTIGTGGLRGLGVRQRSQPSGVDFESQTILPPTLRLYDALLNSAHLLTFTFLCNMNHQHLNYTGSDVSYNHDSDFLIELHRYQAMCGAIKRV